MNIPARIGPRSKLSKNVTAASMAGVIAANARGMKFNNNSTMIALLCKLHGPVE
jgi:hypothetical protein